MTKEQAYCCLNCSATGNCCGPCGECNPCCEDCGDTSTCKASAFLDKDDNFYLKWQGTYSSQYSKTDSEFNDTTCIDNTHVDAAHSVSSFDSDGNCKNSYSSNWVNSKSCCECDCSDNAGGYKVSIIGDENSLTTTTTAGPSTEDPDGEGCENLDGYSITEPGPGLGCPGPSEREEKQNSRTISSGGSGDDNYIISTLSSNLKATVTWNTSLSLYDSKGDVVEDPWSILSAPNPYDPLNPIRVVSAPACHFFHP